MLIHPEFNDDDLTNLNAIFDAAARQMGINGVKPIAFLVFKIEHAIALANQAAQAPAPESLAEPPKE